jgi:SAM-dependent methyltransferase
MTATSYTDRHHLSRDAYADPAKLTARTSIYDYQQPRHHLIDHVTDMLRDIDGPILDVGCGPGRYARALRATRSAQAGDADHAGHVDPGDHVDPGGRVDPAGHARSGGRAGRLVVAADLSVGMVAVAGPPALAADVTALPFRSGSFAAATALHMLYHVPKPAEALAELARVLRPGGTLLISTNAADDKREMRELHVAAAREAGMAGGTAHGPRFLLDETEAAARAVFADVRRTELTAEVVVPTADPVVAFIESTGTWHADVSPVVLDRVRARVEAEIAASGAFRFRTRMGFLSCR